MVGSRRDPDFSHEWNGVFVMEDRELLEMAAKAAGIEVIRTDPQGLWIAGGWGDHWNPLKDDSDALRLAVILKVQIIIHDDWVAGLIDGIQWSSPMSCYSSNGCMYETTRRAVVMAAARIGKETP